MVFLILSTTSAAEDKSIFKGRALDIDGKAVENAQVFIYDSPDTRRLADFISAKTDKEGRFHIVLPSGKYWAVARLKKGEIYGPLMPGDKHSGEPVEIELAPNIELARDFAVMDIREAARIRQKIREDYIRLSGKIINEKGLPVEMAYAFASKDKKVSGVPDYISAWTDDEGDYTLYLLPGTYYIGVATEFPPDQNYTTQEVVLKGDRVDLDIVINGK
jgi:hypothetical protein